MSPAFALLRTVCHLRTHAEVILVAQVAQLLALIDIPLREEADARKGPVAVRRAHRVEVEVRVTREVDARGDLVVVRVRVRVRVRVGFGVRVRDILVVGLGIGLGSAGQGRG